MKEELIATLEEFGYPVYLQGSLAEKAPYPDSFFTFWNNETRDQSHYDNKPLDFVWDFTVFFYSTDPALVNRVLVQTKNKLKAKGWIIGGKGYDAASDEPTHTGRALDVLKVEKNI